METVQVLRIESARGKGPYNFASKPKSLEKALSSHNGSSQHPGPAVDFGNGWPWGWEDYLSFTTEKRNLLFGFGSVESFKEWFDSEILDVIKASKKFFLVTYEVPKESTQFGRSKKQLVFDKKVATLVKKEALA